VWGIPEICPSIADAPYKCHFSEMIIFCIVEASKGWKFDIEKKKWCKYLLLFSLIRI